MTDQSSVVHEVITERNTTSTRLTVSRSNLGLCGVVVAELREPMARFSAEVYNDTREIEDRPKRKVTSWVPGGGSEPVEDHTLTESELNSAEETPAPDFTEPQV